MFIFHLFIILFSIMESKRNNLFDVISPAQTFVFGIVAGIMTLCTIGFFVLLSIMLTGGNFAMAKTSGGNAVAAAPNAAAPTAAAPTAARQVTIDIDEKNDHILGDKNAKVTIVEFSDAECPFCSRFHPTMQQVMADYDGDVRWIFRHFPLESIHPTARKLAVASECAAQQGKFWEFTDQLYERQGSFSADTVIKGLAKELGLNASKFDSCFDGRETDNLVQDDLNAATAAGCTGTPCSIVIDKDGNTTPINGAFPIDRVKAIIDPLLK